MSHPDGTGRLPDFYLTPALSHQALQTGKWTLAMGCKQCPHLPCGLHQGPPLQQASHPLFKKIFCNSTFINLTWNS